MIWILVFFLQHPQNYTEYEKYTNEMQCRDAEQMWNRRFKIVKSEMVAECRKKFTE